MRIRSKEFQQNGILHDQKNAQLKGTQIPHFDFIRYGTERSLFENTQLKLSELEVLDQFFRIHS